MIDSRNSKYVQEDFSASRRSFGSSSAVSDNLNSLTGRQLTQLAELNWLEQQYNLILLGPPGVGKTFLAIGLGIESIHRGFNAQASLALRAGSIGAPLKLFALLN